MYFEMLNTEHFWSLYLPRSISHNIDNYDCKLAWHISLQLNWVILSGVSATNIKGQMLALKKLLSAKKGAGKQTKLWVKYGSNGGKYYAFSGWPDGQGKLSRSADGDTYIVTIARPASACRHCETLHNITSPTHNICIAAPGEKPSKAGETITVSG